MKKYLWGFLLTGISLLSLGAVPSVSFAQGTSQIVIYNQGLVNNTSTAHYASGGTQYASYTTYVGNGKQASTTGAFVQVKGTVGGGVGQGYVTLNIVAWPTSGYGTGGAAFVGYCQFDTAGQPDANGFVQMTLINTFGTGCNVLPQYYYEIQLSYARVAVTGGIDFIYGSNTRAGPSANWNFCFPASHDSLPDCSDSAISTFAPAFAVVTNGFQIVPTTQSTGLFLSGAAEFCNAQFGTSTGIINGLANDFGNAICQAVGYLFVPTPSSIQSFQTIPENISATPPISWFGEIKDTIELQEASSTDNFINLNIDFGTTTSKLGFSTLDVISTTTLSKYLSNSNRIKFRGLIAIFFYLITASFLYFELKRIWKTT